MKYAYAAWMSRALPIVAAITLLGVASPPAKADTYDLTAQILYFRSWIYPANAYLDAQANSAALVDSGQHAGSYQGSDYNWSQFVSVGGPSVTFGYDPAISPNRLLNGFGVTAGSPVTVVPGQTFDLATLSFTNGQWFYKADVSVHFVATDRTTGKNNVFDGTFEITSVSSTPVRDSTGQLGFNPYAEADYVTLNGSSSFGSVRVFDKFAQPANNPGNVGTFQFTAKIGSLDPVGFASPTGGAFLDSSVDSGLSDPHVPASAVPEPSTWAMLLIGFAGLGFAKHRNTKRAAPFVG